MELERAFILKISDSFLICQVDRDQRETHERPQELQEKTQNWKVALMALMALMVFLAAFFLVENIDEFRV